MDREAWCAVIHGVSKSQTRLSSWTELNLLCWQLVLTGCQLGALCQISYTCPLHKAWNFYDCLKKVVSPFLGQLISCSCCLVLSHVLTLCDPMACSLPGFSVHGILLARILEWVAISSSGDIPNPGLEPMSPVSPALQAVALLLSHQGSTCSILGTLNVLTYMIT